VLGCQKRLLDHIDTLKACASKCEVDSDFKRVAGHFPADGFKQHNLVLLRDFDFAEYGITIAELKLESVFGVLISGLKSSD
jgi:hypothetical protein